MLHQRKTCLGHEAAALEYMYLVVTLIEVGNLWEASTAWYLFLKTEYDFLKCLL